MNIINLKSETIFGLDIGYETIKIVEINGSGKNIELVGFINVPLPNRILEKDRFKNIADTANLVKESLRKAKPHSITAKKIVTSLPEAFVFSKTMKLPRTETKKYEDAIMTEAAQYLPLPIEEVYLDYQILIEHPNEEMLDILVVASPKKLVNDYVELANLAGLELAALETKPIATGRALISQNQVKDSVMIIHVGTEITRLSIWDDGKIRLNSTVPTGKNHILENLGYTGDVTALEKIKIDKDNEKDGLFALGPIIEEVISAIKYHQNRDFKPSPISKIIVCGSGALVKGIDVLLEKEIKIKTEIATIKLKNQTLGPEFVAAYGLALRNDF